jgi:hypothetical protein
MVSGRLPDDIQVEGAPLGQLQLGFPQAQLELNGRALSLGTATPGVRTALTAANAWTWAARGGWDSALTTMSTLARASDVPGVQSLAYQSYGLSVLGAVLGTVRPESAEERREAVVALINRLSDEKTKQFSRAWLAWLDGMLGFARRDQQAINMARRQARATGWLQADLIDSSLAAFGHALQGNRRRAGRELAALEDYCIAHQGCNSMIPHTAVQRLFAGQWLLEAGELQSARRLLQSSNWQSVGWSWTTGDVLAAFNLLTRARVEEALGSNDAARFYYEQFLRRYDQPLPAQAHLVTEAKAALARLQTDQQESP